MNKQETYRYIVNILSSEPDIFFSWGVTDFEPIEYQNMNGVTFMTDGFIHNGRVNIVFNMDGDYFEVFIIDENEKIVNHVRDVYFDDLVDVVDRLVERGDMTDAEYDSKLDKWFNEILA